MNVSLETRLRKLHDFTLLQLDRAHDLAEGGRKDEARDWARYSSNSGIIELLADSEVGIIGACERNRMTKSLNDLHSACHPLDVHDYRSDLAALRGELEKITRHLGIGETLPVSDGSDKIIPSPFLGAHRPASGV